MIHHHLKKLREGNHLTLKELSSRVGYGTGNLSSYENGKLKAKDETLLRILTRGYHFKKKDAEIMIAVWRKEEIEELYRLHLAQVTGKYNQNKRKPPKNLEDFLKAEGFDKKFIEKIMSDIEFYKKEMK